MERINKMASYTTNVSLFLLHGRHTRIYIYKYTIYTNTPRFIVMVLSVVKDLTHGIILPIRFDAHYTHRLDKTHIHIHALY